MHRFAKIFDVTVTDHMQTAGVCIRRHFSHEVVFCKTPLGCPVICKTRAVVCKTPDHQAVFCKPPTVFCKPPDSPPVVVCKTRAVVCKTQDSHSRWFAKHRTVTAGGLQTIGGGLQNTGQSQAVVCKPPAVICILLADRDWCYAMRRGLSLLWLGLFCKPPPGCPVICKTRLEVCKIHVFFQADDG